MQIGFFLTYPFLVHLGVYFHLPILHGLAIVSLACGVFYKSMKRFNLGAWLTVIVVAIVAALASLKQYSHFLLYIPPVVVPLLVAWGFIRTLFPGQVPLITDMGEKSRGPLSEEMRSYTRKVTIIWSVCLLIMFFWGLMLPIFASFELWSLFTNIVNQVLVVSLFVGEFAYRVYRFRDHNHPGFIEYIAIVVRSLKRKESVGNE